MQLSLIICFLPLPSSLFPRPDCLVSRSPFFLLPPSFGHPNQSHTRQTKQYSTQRCIAQCAVHSRDSAHLQVDHTTIYSVHHTPSKPSLPSLTKSANNSPNPPSFPLPPAPFPLPPSPTVRSLFLALTSAPKACFFFFPTKAPGPELITDVQKIQFQSIK